MTAALHGWENFYVIVGSSAAALTGLQFVVIALLSEAKGIGGEHEIEAFGTPQVVHFCAVLLIAAICSTPGHSSMSLGVCFTISAIAALAYTTKVVIHARHQTGYQPVFEDWLWHAILPLTAYASFFIAGMRVWTRPVQALYVVAAAALLLLYIGIHNTWDTAIYISSLKREKSPQ